MPIQEGDDLGAVTIDGAVLDPLPDLPTDDQLIGAYVQGQLTLASIDQIRLEVEVAAARLHERGIDYRRIPAGWQPADPAEDPEVDQVDPDPEGDPA